MLLAVPPSSITMTSSVTDSLQIVGSDVMLTCTVELNLAILDSEISLLTVNAHLSRNGTQLAVVGSTVTDKTFIYTAQLTSFQRTDFGDYTCTATVRPQPTSAYLTGGDVLSDTVTIKAGKLL